MTLIDRLTIAACELVNHDIDASAVNEAIRVLMEAQEPPPNTVRVRIAVAVDNTDHVAAMGIDQLTSDDEARSMIHDGYAEFNSYAIRAFGFVEADLPLLPTVSGRVVESEAKNG